MQPLPSPSFRRLTLGRAAALVALAGAFAACDRHSAAEVPESYGHGSSHVKSYTDHQSDTRNDSRSFSDTQGLDVNSEGKPNAAPPTATPGATTAGQFLPVGATNAFEVLL